MNEDRAEAGNEAAAADEPALTERNTETIRGEEELGGKTGAAPAPTYGPAGSTTDADE